MGGLTPAAEQQYSLRWNDFHSSILSSFRHLRDEEDFVDVTLACDGRSFTAHKVVLSACSPYFRRLLKANPCNHPIVILRDVHEKDMEALLRFMYNGEVHVGHEQLPDFLKTAQTLQVRGLADVPNKENRLPTMLNDSAWPTPGDDAPSRESAAEGSLSPPPSKRSRMNEDRHTPQHERDVSRDHRERERERDLDRRDQERERDQQRDQDRDCSPAARRTPHHLLNNSIGPEHHSLLGQALEGGPLQNKNTDSSAHVSSHSTGEDDDESNSGSDTGMSERGISGLADMVHPKSEPSDYSMEENNGHVPGNGSLGMDSHRSPNFPAALLGLQGLPGLLPGPSGLHASQENNFGNSCGSIPGSVVGSSSIPGSLPWYSVPSHLESNTSQGSLEDSSIHQPYFPPQVPRPLQPKPKCPECGKEYSNNSNLKQHIANVHTEAQHWETCHVCRKQFKTRQYLQVHMLSSHGIRQRKSYQSGMQSFHPSFGNL